MIPLKSPLNHHPAAHRPRDPGPASAGARRPPSGRGPAAAAGNGRRAAG